MLGCGFFAKWRRAQVKGVHQIAMEAFEKRHSVPAPFSKHAGGSVATEQQRCHGTYECSLAGMLTAPPQPPLRERLSETAWRVSTDKWFFRFRAQLVIGP